MELFNGDNLNFEFENVDLVFADCIYESLNFSWISHYWNFLKNNGVFIVMTDYHFVAQMKLFLDNLPDANFAGWLIYKQEWGGVPRKGFAQKHDDILIYSKGEGFKWYGDRIQIPKVTAGTKFDKKGTGLKTPCSVFDDLGNFSTISKERIKNNDGKNIRWQKPLKLLDRLLLPFTDEGDLIVDPFLGSGTTAIWAKRNNRHFKGIEIDPVTFDIAQRRLFEENTWRQN